jgi:hypothetical protein
VTGTRVLVGVVVSLLPPPFAGGESVLLRSHGRKGKDGTRSVCSDGIAVGRESNYPDKLPFTAKQPPEEDCGYQSGESFKPFILRTPIWKPATHTASLTVLRTRVVG